MYQVVRAHFHQPPPGGEPPYEALWVPQLPTDRGTLADLAQILTGRHTQSRQVLYGVYPGSPMSQTGAEMYALLICATPFAEGFGPAGLRQLQNWLDEYLQRSLPKGLEVAHIYKSLVPMARGADKTLYRRVPEDFGPKAGFCAILSAIDPAAHRSSSNRPRYGASSGDTPQLVG